MTDARLSALEATISELQQVRHNLVAAHGAQALALTIIIRLLVTKGVSSTEEISGLFLGALASLPESEQRGIAGRALRDLANSVTEAAPARH
jgi:hypothetical protein